MDNRKYIVEWQRASYGPYAFYGPFNTHELALYFVAQNKMGDSTTYIHLLHSVE